MRKFLHSLPSSKFSSFQKSIINTMYTNLFKIHFFIIFQQKEKTFEDRLEELKDNNLIQPDINISMFNKWRNENAGEMRQSGGGNPFFEWISFLLGGESWITWCISRDENLIIFHQIQSQQRPQHPHRSRLRNARFASVENITRTKSSVERRQEWTNTRGWRCCCIQIAFIAAVRWLMIDMCWVRLIFEMQHENDLTRFFDNTFSVSFWDFAASDEKLNTFIRIDSKSLREWF